MNLDDNVIAVGSPLLAHVRSHFRCRGDLRCLVALTQLGSGHMMDDQRWGGVCPQLVYGGDPGDRNLWPRTLQRVNLDVSHCNIIRPFALLVQYRVVNITTTNVLMALIAVGNTALSFPEVFL